MFRRLHNLIVLGLFWCSLFLIHLLFCVLLLLTFLLFLFCAVHCSDLYSRIKCVKQINSLAKKTTKKNLLFKISTHTRTHKHTK